MTRDAHAVPNVARLQPRHAMAYMRGPTTRTEVRAALKMRRGEPVSGTVAAVAE